MYSITKPNHNQSILILKCVAQHFAYKYSTPILNHCWGRGTLSNMDCSLNGKSESIHDISGKDLPQIGLDICEEKSKGNQHENDYLDTLNQDSPSKDIGPHQEGCSSSLGATCGTSQFINQGKKYPKKVIIRNEYLTYRSENFVNTKTILPSDN